MHLRILHSTRYQFERPVTFALQQVRKTPKSSHQQNIVTWQTDVQGGRKELMFEDHHHNVTELISFDHNTTELTIVSQGEVTLNDTHGIVGKHRGLVPLWLFNSTTDRTEPGAGVRSLVAGMTDKPQLDDLHRLSEIVRNAIDYRVGSSQPDWTAEDAIAAGSGVCQDHTHVFIACARMLGVPARYVSGYLMLDDRTTQDAMHAWAEAHLDGIGWVGFDVANGISPDVRYVRVATGLDYSDAAPVSGTRIGGAGEVLHVQIDVAQQ